MSRSFINIFTRFSNLLNNTQFYISKIPTNIRPILLSSVIVCHYSYTFMTEKTDIIKIKRLYTYTRNGSTEFMVIDEYGKHFNINNSFWYWKWNSIEDWNNININDVLYIKYYGYRIPLLGLFPNIVYVDKQNQLSKRIEKEEIKDFLFSNLSNKKFLTRNL